jgi:integrase/recombinase XerD
MVTQFVLRTDKKDSTGRCPVHLVVYFDGARLKCATGEKCKLADWNADRQKFRASYPLAEEANMLLGRLAADVLVWWRAVRATGEVPTLAGLRAALRPVEVPPTVQEELSVIAEMLAFRELQRSRGITLYTLKHYLVTANWLRDFEAWASMRLLVATYDVAMHDRFLAYLRTVRKLAPNTLYTAGKDLRRLFRYLREERSQVLLVEPKQLRVAWVETEKLYLRAEDLERLRVAMLTVALEKVRDIFLFCCYTGLRYSDVLQLHGGNLEPLPDGSGRVLRLIQTKTRTSVSIYLSSAASALLDKYAEPERTGPGARLLPVLANAVMNRYLKRIGRLAGFTRLVEIAEMRDNQMVKQAVPAWRLLTMHAARHSFAVQSLLRGMPVAVLQRVMGHSSITTTMMYAKVIEDFQHQAMRTAWDEVPVVDSGTASGLVCSAVLGAA